MRVGAADLPWAGLVGYLAVVSARFQHLIAGDAEREHVCCIAWDRRACKFRCHVPGSARGIIDTVNTIISMCHVERGV